MGLRADGRVCPQAAVQLADSAVFDDLSAALDDYIAVNDQQVDHSSRRNQTTANRLMFGLLLLGTCGGVAGLLLGYAIARRVGRTIIEVAVSLGDVAGKLNKVVGPVAVTANPRIHDLEMVLQTISQHVSTVVERLQASERETLRAEQLAAMGQLAAGMAHEIRNPLTSMKTIVQLAENPEDFSSRDIRILDEEIARLEQSVQAFLDYARPAPAEKREITLGEIVEQPLALMARRADRQRIGKFEQAHGGTIFLDEVGDMSVATQAKVLRVLQDGSFQRVGGSKTIRTDVRVLAATNQNLDAKIDSAEFRQDLLYRLNGFTVHLPPLRDRREDLPDLVQYFLRVTNRQVNKPAFSISPKTMELLQHYDWPGNVRELQSVIKYSVVHTVGDTITPDCLPETCRGKAAQARCPRPEDELAGISRYVRLLLASGEPDIYRKLQSTSDRLVLAEVLRHVRGNQVHASEHLGMSRTTLRSKLQALGMLDEDFA